MLASTRGSRGGQAVQRLPAGRLDQAGEACRDRGGPFPFGHRRGGAARPSRPARTSTTRVRGGHDMTTTGIDAVFLETHNWGRSAGFFQALGFTLDFETDHNSGLLRNGDGP